MAAPVENDQIDSSSKYVKPQEENKYGENSYFNTMANTKPRIENVEVILLEQSEITLKDMRITDATILGSLSLKIKSNMRNTKNTKIKKVPFEVSVED